MSLLEFTSAPVDLNKQIKKSVQKTKQAKGIKTPRPSRRLVEASATVYGDELFQAAYKPAKSIVVKFHPYTLSLIRVDFEGRFAIQYFKADEQAKGIQADKFLLYRFFTPIEYEYEEKDYQIELTENVKTYGPFEHVQNIRDKILEILKRKMLEEREATKNLAIAEEKRIQLAKEKANDEAERITEQLAATGASRNISSSERETKIESEQSSQAENILPETEKKETASIIELGEIGKPTASFLTENVEVKEEVEDKIVTIMKRENQIVKFITKMPKSKAIAWIEGKASFYIKE